MKYFKEITFLVLDSIAPNMSKVAVDLGMSRQNLYRVIDSRGCPSLKVGIQLANYLSVPLRLLCPIQAIVLGGYEDVDDYLDEVSKYVAPRLFEDIRRKKAPTIKEIQKFLKNID